MMLQLNPTIPMMTPRGSGYALFVVDYSQEPHLMWVVALDDGGEIRMFENPEVRVQSNFTLGRRPDGAFGLRAGRQASGGMVRDLGHEQPATLTDLPQVEGASVLRPR